MPRYTCEYCSEIFKSKRVFNKHYCNKECIETPIISLQKKLITVVKQKSKLRDRIANLKNDLNVKLDFLNNSIDIQTELLQDISLDTKLDIKRMVNFLDYSIDIQNILLEKKIILLEETNKKLELEINEPLFRKMINTNRGREYNNLFSIL